MTGSRFNATMAAPDQRETFETQVRNSFKPRFFSVSIFFWVLAICLAWAPPTAKAQDTDSVASVPWTGGPAIRESIRDIMARDRAQLPGAPPPQRITSRGRIPHEKRGNSEAPNIQQGSSANPAQIEEGPEITSAIQIDTPVEFDIQTPGTNFLAATYGISGYIPPNAVGAVGPSQILVAANGRIRTFTKAGVLDGVLDTTTDLFFQTVRNGAATTDSRVVFDQLSQRWFVSMITMPAQPNRVLLAVSSGATVTSSTSFSFFYFQQDLVGPTPNVDTGYFADFPTLGV